MTDKIEPIQQTLGLGKTQALSQELSISSEDIEEMLSAGSIRMMEKDDKSIKDYKNKYGSFASLGLVLLLICLVAEVVYKYVWWAYYVTALTTFFWLFHFTIMVSFKKEADGRSRWGVSTVRFDVDKYTKSIQMLRGTSLFRRIIIMLVAAFSLANLATTFAGTLFVSNSAPSWVRWLCFSASLLVFVSYVFSCVGFSYRFIDISYKEYVVEYDSRFGGWQRLN